MKKLAIILFMTFLTLTSWIPAAAFADELVETKATAVSGVSFRDRPTTASNVMRYLKKNEVVTVLAMVNPNWVQIQDAQGVTGYVSSSSKYIEMTSNSKIIWGVNFRSAPSSSASLIRFLSKGEELLVLEKANDSWYKAKDSSGVIGYVSSSSKYIITNLSITRIELPLSERIETIIEEATSFMGTPYEYGSERFNPFTFDCSDLIQQAAWNATRMVLPGDSRGQGDLVKGLGQVTGDWTKLKRGDLMFFSSYYGYRASDYATVDKSSETITHAGIYLGDGRILHTYSQDSGGVRIDVISNNHWEYRFLFGGSFTN
jgi:cell wall-associated NlpC family hydrolase